MIGTGWDEKIPIQKANSKPRRAKTRGSPPRAVTPRMVGVGMVANVFQRRSLDLHFAI